MKDKTITNAHFDYVNEQIKIIGFKNLADFETNIPYTKLKVSQKEICNKINITINWFKKIFPQEGFDLRKINYTFENIDQVLGFIKKLFGYLSIQYDYSRIKGIPTLRLIPPNNLYNKYIMDLRNIPQNDFFLSLNANDKKNDINQLTSKPITIVSKFSNSSIYPDFITKDKKYISDKVEISDIIENIKKIKITDIIDKLEKNEIVVNNIFSNKFNFNLISLDWIKSMSIKITNQTVNKSLPLGTTISLIIENDNEIILHSIDEHKLKQFRDNGNEQLKIELPNNFLYKNSDVYLQINLPEKINNLDTELNDYFKNNLNFTVESTGWKIKDKKIVMNMYLINKIIEIDTNTLYRNLDFGIFDGKIMTQIDKIYKSLINYNNGSFSKINNHINITSNLCLKMSYLLKYLKKPFEKKYIINDSLCLTNINSFDYFNWIKIKCADKHKLSNGTKIELIIGGVIVLTSIVTYDTLFDDENYFKFEINFPNSILYKYHSIELKITLPYSDKNYDGDGDGDDDNDDNTDNKEDNYYTNNLFNIVINGSCFKVSTPKMFFNATINYDHDSKWFIAGKKEFVSMSGMVGNLLHKKEQQTIKDDDIVIFYKKLKSKKFLTTSKIEFDCGIKYTCIFADINLANNKIKSDAVDPLMFLISSDLKRYIGVNNHIFEDTNPDSFSFGSNKFFGSVKCCLCELTEPKKCKIYFTIKKQCDLIKHFDLELLSKNFNKLNMHIYNFDAWIEYKSEKIYDFGTKTLESKIRLNCENKYINLVGSQENVYLVIEIPNYKFDDWKVLNMSIGHIFCDTIIRKNLFQHACPTVNVI